MSDKIAPLTICHPLHMRVLDKKVAETVKRPIAALFPPPPGGYSPYSDDRDDRRIFKGL